MITHFWYVSKYIERNPLKANIVNKIENYVYQSYFQWKNNSKYYLLLKNSKILEMNLEDYEVFISSDIESEILEKIYDIPKSVKIDGKTKILNKRIETFFNIDQDIDRNKNIKKAYEYGYTKSDIANYLDLNHSTITRIVAD